MNTQSGRSMVEMLGVLAIIGVLSVGAISGYGKAMFKYRLNKQTEQLNQVIGTIVRYKSSLMLNPAPADAPISDYQLVPILKKLGEIPKEMYTNNNRLIKDAFETEYYIYNRNDNKKGVVLRTNNLDRNENSFQICKNLYLIAKEWHQELSVIIVSAYKGDTYSSKGCYLGDNSTYHGCSSKRYIKDLKLSELDDICRTATGEQGHYSVSIDF
jgi:type II secretory pathway pseudopilin PulG